MKRLLFIILLTLTTSVFSQKSINNYKYVIVPTKFDFLKSTDQYKTSSLTKFLFNKHGFKAFLANEKLPKDLAENRCLAIIADVKSNSGMFTTKNFIELKDCSNNILFTSIEGKSKIKEYKRAYHEAIKRAFKSVQKLNYKYLPEIKENVDVMTNAPAIVKTPEVVVGSKPVEVKKTENVLYAQPITNGFQLVNTKPEVVFQVLKTNLKDVFVIKDKNGVIYKSGSSWIAEYNLEGAKKTETYQIKF
ncbi:hypothetical protein WH52_06985 [Tenacibaculum holothuriorum]|uniref:Uncharacterized protein n=1 Tax=Tenacibaculum holothuriorum TaxID=1635173 RepID=A0A1Y2PER2_9FLAO|nr:hypothetical protein [Tenacibaculum holothuriorum]OSY88491.1 hypothetical protein WH52_06985 [Tenacibaculum holothuriorum]